MCNSQSQPNQILLPFAHDASIAPCRQVTLGGHSTLDPPLPISNRTVKRSRADDSARTVCESRSPPGSPKITSPPAQPRRGLRAFIKQLRYLSNPASNYRPGPGRLQRSGLTRGVGKKTVIHRIGQQPQNLSHNPHLPWNHAVTRAALNRLRKAPCRFSRR